MADALGKAVRDAGFDEGANVNARGPHGHTALMYAAYNGYLESVKLLLAAGANVTATASDSDEAGAHRYSALTLAEDQQHERVASLLRQALSSAGQPP